MLIMFYEGVMFYYDHYDYRAILQHSISTHITSVTQVKSNNYNQFENRPIWLNDLSAYIRLIHEIVIFVITTVTIGVFCNIDLLLI